MSEAEESWSEFERLIAAAEMAATKLDGATLEGVLHDLNVWWDAEALSPRLDPQTLSTIRNRLVRFYDVCRFVGGTLEHAFGLEEQQPEANRPYRRSTRGPVVQPALLDGYG